MNSVYLQYLILYEVLRNVLTEAVGIPHTRIFAKENKNVKKDDLWR